ncbi:hypothetical protein EXE46_03675 [Halorubrum sp. GN11_10-6_MGM]|uniref:hypothetical protein n=1 Tax=Halorubrum sp. GN11_10-6_MGM TaxID=2518112 RepID=UPI0010F868F5|nr:hypothetical protein [Halorubrum sp. GN11_10-6_MGM]TKX75557.1 hypothetical protein EXE46_03675 [Halorubrum sp. GN11_10-6_MGM]
MPGSRSNSPLGSAVGAAAALLAVALLALNRWTDLNVPYGYDSGSTALFLVGAVAAVVAVAVVGYRYVAAE